MDSKAECGQLNLAHVARKNITKKKLKQTNASAHLVPRRNQYMIIHTLMIGCVFLSHFCLIVTSPTVEGGCNTAVYNDFVQLFVCL